MASEKTATGLPRNTAAALAYVLGPVTGIVFLLLEKDPFIKFHAAQSIVVVGGLTILWMILPLTLILLPLTPLVFVALFILWLVLIYKAWQGDEWEVPFLGKYARKLVKKTNK